MQLKCAHMWPPYVAKYINLVTRIIEKFVIDFVIDSIFVSIRSICDLDALVDSLGYTNQYVERGAARQAKKHGFPRGTRVHILTLASPLA